MNVHVTNIMSLPVIYGSNPNKILEFYETLSPKLQALETMGKIKEVNGYVRMRLDKLEGIRGDFVRTDDNWQDWKFPHLLEALRKWTTRNPPKPVDERPGKEKTFPSKPLKTKSYSSCTATGRGSVTYPAVVVSVGGIQCRALLDSGAGSSYASAALLDR